MSSINLHTKEITIKVVYYGPGLGGKTSSLQAIHRTLKPELRGQLVSLATGIDRTLYFDFLPIKLPRVKDFTIRMSLYTVPGQVHYNATRKLVLQGADGVVLVADSQVARRDANIESLHNLEDNLRAQGMNPESVPLVLQYNKRDLPSVLGLAQLEQDLNPRGVPRFETCALQGKGIFESLRTITKLVLADLKRKGIYQGKHGPEKTEVSKSSPVVNPRVEESLVQVLEDDPEEPEPVSSPNLGNLRQQMEAQIELHSSIDEPAPPAIQPLRPPKPSAVGPAIPVKKATPASAPESRGLSFSELWAPDDGRSQILALEADIDRGNYEAAIRRAEGILHEYVGQSSMELSLPEALLMLGVFGPHYERLKNILKKTEPLKPDAIFCLFFLADLQLRLQAGALR